jgi:hypothetical protein
VDGDLETPRAPGLRGRPLVAVLSMAALVATAGSAVSLFSRKPAPPSPPPPSPTLPSARDGGAMAYDPATGTVILYGGVIFGSTGNQALGDTWSWNGSRWAELNPASRPSALTAALMAYDPATRAVVLTGGVTTHLLSGVDPSHATWRWDGATWTAQPGGELPPSTGQPAMATDTSSGQLILVTGEPGCARVATWRWDGATWTAISPGTGVSPLGGVGGLAYDPVGRDLVLITDPTGCPAGDTAGQLASTAGTGQAWSWDGSSWRLMGPAPAETGELVSSPSGPLLVAPDATYLWRGGWARVGPGLGVVDAALAYDAGSGQVVLFSGDAASWGGTSLLDDTWTWQPAASGGGWKLRSGAPPPSPGTGSG